MIIPNSYGNLPDVPFFVYAACDEHYFDEFGKCFAVSAQANSKVPVHLHLFNPRPDQLDFCHARSISVTYEYVTLDLFENAANALSRQESPQLKSTLTAMSKGSDSTIVERIQKTYYACARFMRLAELQSSALLLDVDAVVRKPIPTLGNEHDIHLHRIFGKKARCLAGAIYINNTANGQQFIKDYANALMSTITQDRIYWGVDQDLLDTVVSNYNHGQLPTSLIDWNMQPDSVIWTAKGTRKSLEVFVNEQKKYNF